MSTLQTLVLDASSRFRVHRMREPYAVHLGRQEQTQLDAIRQEFDRYGLLISDPSCTEEKYCGLKVVRESFTSEIRIT